MLRGTDLVQELVKKMATIDVINGKYRARVRLKGITRTKTFSRHADAKSWATKTESLINDGAQGNAARNIVFGDLLQRYVSEVTPNKRGSRSETYRINRIIKSDIAKVIVQELFAKNFATWRDNRLKEVSADSVRRELETMSAVCNIAMKEWGLLTDNPVLKITRPKISKARSRRPSEKEITDICLALGYEYGDKPTAISARIGVIVLFAIETAMRSGEICGLSWCDIDVNRRVAHLSMTKNGSSRDVPLSKKALALLDSVRGLDKDSVFVVDDATRDTIFRRARDSMGIHDLHFHDLRREALSRMASKVGVMDLAKISGHKDIRILQNTYYAPDIGSLASLLD